MAKKYRALKIGKHGAMVTESDDSIVCPVSGKNCSSKCAWFSCIDKIVRCQEAVIGAIGGAPMKSFRLSLGPPVYDKDETLDIGLG